MNVEADGRIDTTTPSKQTISPVDRFDKLLRKYDRGDIPKCDWLDALVFKEIDKIKQVKSTTTSNP